VHSTIPPSIKRLDLIHLQPLSRFLGEVHREELDIKPDVHTMRVLFRLGLAEITTPEAAIAATRKVHPECPGELDAALWSIGRKWCFADNPNCFLCPVNNCCEKIKIRAGRDTLSLFFAALNF